MLGEIDFSHSAGSQPLNQSILPKLLCLISLAPQSVDEVCPKNRGHRGNGQEQSVINKVRHRHHAGHDRRPNRNRDQKQFGRNRDCPNHARPGATNWE